MFMNISGELSQIDVGEYGCWGALSTVARVVEQLGNPKDTRGYINVQNRGLLGNQAADSQSTVRGCKREGCVTVVADEGPKARMK